MKLAVHATGKNLKMFSAHFKHFKIAISQILLTVWWNTISSCNSLCRGSPHLCKIHYRGPHLCDYMYTGLRDFWLATKVIIKFLTHP